jgi:diadenosine tetraphosphatase ApaH/serine/threonine PP2A family protein phosphatase
MRVAVISDIHANLHALEAVLEDVDAAAPDEIWCLGDLVGYGPKPNECCAIVADRADLCLVGNHDLVCLGAIDLSMFNVDAAVAAEWTQRTLTETSRKFLRTLEPKSARAGTELFHGSPTDPVWSFVLTGDAALWSFRATDAKLVLVGHSHVALQIQLADDALAGGLAPSGTERELSHGRWLLNPGSVGQPRDGDARAAWLLLDLERMFGSFRRVAYPIEQTQNELRAAGLPEALALRLNTGE